MVAVEIRGAVALASPRRVARLAHARELGRSLGLAGYQINHLHMADALFSLAGKRVLEVGGALPRELVIDHYRCASWTCVDNRTEYACELGFEGREAATAHADWTYLDGRVEDLARSLGERYDVVYSSAVLEHVLDLRRALRTMRDVLVPGGAMFHAIGPIWSGPSGYHIYEGYFRKHGPRAGRTVVEALRPWMHLLKSPQEMLEYLTATVGAELAQDVVESIYESSRLNRYGFRDYLAAFEDAGLDVAWMWKWYKPVRGWVALRTLYRAGMAPRDHMFNTFWAALRARHATGVRHEP